MNENKINNLLKVAIAILALCLLGLGIYTIQSYNESEAYLEELKQEKAELKTELQDLLLNYEEAIADNKHLEEDFFNAKQKIRRLLESAEKMKATYVSLRKYKMQVTSLKKEKQTLFGTIDSLAIANKSLQKVVSHTKSKLVQTEKRSDSLTEQNKKLRKKVSEASLLNVVQLAANGVIVRNNNETKIVDRTRRVDKIEVRFSLAKNKLTTPGKKQLFVQIINPKNNLLGKKSTISFGKAVLNYSKTLNIIYKNERLDISTLINAEKEDLIEGRYIVNVFMGAELLASSRFELE